MMPLSSSAKVLRVWPWLAAICSGLLYAGCFAPFNLIWLCWIALTPLMSAIWFSGNESRRPWLRNLALGYVAGLAFFWTVFCWLTTVTVLGWFVLQFYMAIYIALWAWFCGLLRPRETREQSGRTTKWDQMLIHARSTAAPPRSPWTKSANNLVLAFLLAGGWTAQEWLRGWVFSGWGWNGLGVALHGNWPLIQIAEFTGVAGLSFMVAFANVILLTTGRRLILEARTHTTRPHFDLTLTMATIVGVLTFGLRASQVSPPTKPLRDAALLVSDGGERMQVYRKVHLVPFGEYVPGRYRVPLLARIVGDQVPGDFTAGKEYTVFGLTNSDVQVAPLICFEDTLGELARRFLLPSETNPGANLLVDITNDGWFLHSGGSHQHLANAIFRCVETRRPMARAANTGVTCFINEFGRVTQLLRDDTASTFTEGVLTGAIKIPTEHELTFYTRHGELFAKVCAAITAVAILMVFGLRRSKYV